MRNTAWTLWRSGMLTTFVLLTASGCGYFGGYAAGGVYRNPDFTSSRGTQVFSLHGMSSPTPKQVDAFEVEVIALLPKYGIATETKANDSMGDLEVHYVRDSFKCSGSSDAYCLGETWSALKNPDGLPQTLGSLTMLKDFEENQGLSAYRHELMHYLLYQTTGDNDSRHRGMFWSEINQWEDNGDP